VLAVASQGRRQLELKRRDRQFAELGDEGDYHSLLEAAEHFGMDMPDDCAALQCARRQWLLAGRDRGQALPASQLLDFLQGERFASDEVAEVIRRLVRDGRLTDAALLLVNFPELQEEVVTDTREEENARQVFELTKLMHPEQDAEDLFGPLEEGGLCSPWRRSESPDRRQQQQVLVGGLVSLATTFEEVAAAVRRLRLGSGARLPTVLALGSWTSGAPLRRQPATLLGLCSDSGCELFDAAALLAAGRDVVESSESNSDALENAVGAWRELQSLMREEQVLKVGYGEVPLRDWTLLLRHVQEQLLCSPLHLACSEASVSDSRLKTVLDFRNLLGTALGKLGPAGDASLAWPAVARSLLGIHLCQEESTSHWAHRPLRASQIHHAVVDIWSQLVVLRALCCHRVLLPEVLLGHISPAKVNRRKLDTQSAEEALSLALAVPRLSPCSLARVSRLASYDDGQDGSSELLPGIVEVLEGGFGDIATVCRWRHENNNSNNNNHGSFTAPRPWLGIVSCWELAEWVQELREIFGSCRAPTTSTPPTTTTAQGSSEDSPEGKVPHDPILSDLFDLARGRHALDLLYRGQ
ncbi:unnamed protein product, partial [Polarella glacialis]